MPNSDAHHAPEVVNDISAGGVAGLMVASIIGVAMTIAALVTYFDYEFDIAREGKVAALTHEVAEQRAWEAETLNSYGWTDKEKKIARIPVDKAKELLLKERGR